MEVQIYIYKNVNFFMILFLSKDQTDRSGYL